MKGRVLLDGVVLEGVAVLELLTSEDQTLLIWWDTFLVLDLGLDVLDSVSWLDLKSDVLASESLNEDLHFSKAGPNRLPSSQNLTVVDVKYVFKHFSFILRST